MKKQRIKYFCSMIKQYKRPRFAESQEEKSLTYARKYQGIGKVPLTRRKKKKATGRREIQLGSFDQTALSRLILGFYLRNPPELPTVDKIYSEELNLPAFPPLSRATSHKWVIKLGFVCKKRNMKLKVYQRMDIVFQKQMICES